MLFDILCKLAQSRPHFKWMVPVLQECKLYEFDQRRIKKYTLPEEDIEVIHYPPDPVSYYEGYHQDPRQPQYMAVVVIDLRKINVEIYDKIYTPEELKNRLGMIWVMKTNKPVRPEFKDMKILRVMAPTHRPITGKKKEEENGMFFGILQEFVSLNWDRLINPLEMKNYAADMGQFQLIVEHISQLIHIQKTCDVPVETLPPQVRDLQDKLIIPPKGREIHRIHFPKNNPLI